MKSRRSEYESQQAIIKGLSVKPRPPVNRPPTGFARFVWLATWLLVGFTLPFALVGILQQWLATH